MKMSSAHTEKGEAMTREKAIEIIIELVSNWQAEYTLNDLELRALEMAIDALEVDFVKCKECRHYREEFEVCTAGGWNISPTRYPKVFEGGYCHRGDRRSDE